MEYISLTLDAKSEFIRNENKKAIEDMNSILKKVGFKISFYESPNSDYDFAYFSKTEDFEKIHTRNAGRKRIDHTCFITFGELKKKLKSSKADQVAKECGVSRSTLFRRIKEAEEKNLADDDFIF